MLFARTAQARVSDGIGRWAFWKEEVRTRACRGKMLAFYFSFGTCASKRPQTTRNICCYASLAEDLSLRSSDLWVPDTFTGRIRTQRRRRRPPCMPPQVRPSICLAPLRFSSSLPPLAPGGGLYGKGTWRQLQGDGAVRASRNTKRGREYPPRSAGGDAVSPRDSGSVAQHTKRASGSLVHHMARKP